MEGLVGRRLSRRYRLDREPGPAGGVEHLHSSTAEAIAAPTEHHGVKSVGEDSWDQDLAFAMVEEPAGQVLDHGWARDGSDALR